MGGSGKGKSLSLGARVACRISFWFSFSFSDISAGVKSGWEGRESALQGSGEFRKPWLTCK